MINVRLNGAIGDGIADDTTAIQNCINTSRCVYIPEGTYLISQTLTLNYPNQVIYGDGFSTVLKCITPINMINIIPSSYGSGGALKDFCLDGPIINGIMLTTNLPVELHTIERIWCNQVSQNTVLLNNTNSDGYFCSRIKDCLLMGSLSLLGAGDSLIISGNTITGVGNGISMNFIQGAACCEISNNNITTTGIALTVGTGALLMRICNNQIEKWQTTSNTNAYTVQIAGDPNTPNTNIAFTNNNINSMGHASSADMVICGCNNVFVDGNCIGNNGASIYIVASTGTHIGKHNILSGIIVDQGTGTIRE
jgi:hypothetical protein